MDNQNLLKEIIFKNRIPFHAQLMLTNKCNFQCFYCYMEPLKSRNTDLTLETWKNIVDILKSKKCVSVTLTGGEPLAYKYFEELYTYIYNQNLKITIITNLSLINKYISLFSEMPPENLVGTLYGTNNETYKKFCKVDSGWDIVKNNIIKLNNCGINFRLQSVLTSYNFSCLNEMVDFTKFYNISYHAYRTIGCDVDGGDETLKCSIDEEQFIKSYKILDDYNSLQESMDKYECLWGEGYKECGAGISSCYIDYKGYMFLCNQQAEERISLLDKGFDACWEYMYTLRKRYIEKETPCSDCKFHALCGKCAPQIKKIENSKDYFHNLCTRTSHLIDVMEKS